MRHAREDGACNSQPRQTMEPMQQLLYVSNTARDADPAMLEDILAASRRNNPPLAITGILLHADGGFLQVLEGEADTVSALFDRIAADKRHWNTHVLLKRMAERAFGEWSMGFHRLSQSDGEMFQISADAIAGRLRDAGQPVLVRLMENFYRIQTGEDGFAGTRA
jgi:hypothetical protein